jgi:hypothetical protein
MSKWRRVERHTGFRSKWSEFLKSIGKTPEDLAKATGYTLPNVASWVFGYGVPSGSVVIKLLLGAEELAGRPVSVREVWEPLTSEEVAEMFRYMLEWVDKKRKGG